MPVEPYSLKDAPALIERLFPAQKISLESYKEQMAVHGKTLTALGSYWKGRKPLVLNKACILGCLLPATDDPEKDLEIYELLMGMDNLSLAKRLKTRLKPAEILSSIKLDNIYQFFDVKPEGSLPLHSPINVNDYTGTKVTWKAGTSEDQKHTLESKVLAQRSFQDLVDEGFRTEEVGDTLYVHVWDIVNAHLGTQADSMPELIEQLGTMRFGHRPKVADTFAGSGQIPFEASRLGCDAYASDLNPIACMLSWGAFNIVGASPENRKLIEAERTVLVSKVQFAIDALGIEQDDKGWRTKVHLYCVEVRCPKTDWIVPLLPTFVVSKGYKVIARLMPDVVNRRYDIKIISGVSESELNAAEKGTVRSDGPGSDPYMIHFVDGFPHKTTISTLRGDYSKDDGTDGNRLRQWGVSDFKPRPDDIFQERLYAVQWMRPKAAGKSFDYEFRSVTEDDLKREKIVEDYVEKHLADWQKNGWVPDMRIEPGDKTDEPIRTRGWTHWHHFFNPRQLLLSAHLNQNSQAVTKFGFFQVLNNNCRSSRWHPGAGGGGATVGIFDNQALNTLYNYGCRSSEYCRSFLLQNYKNSPKSECLESLVLSKPADKFSNQVDIFITDPPYGDAVKYEEILEFFIAWLRKNPPTEFADWVWDSRRALAIKGEDHDFRLSMVAAYKRMTECMPDNGIQIIMFTHQSGTIWADMANIVWASGLRVTAAWYVVTETDSALREGSHVKGTVLLVLRKRTENLSTFQDDLAWELADEVKRQIETLTGLDQKVKAKQRGMNLFNDADLQMAGYAAALRVLTKYSKIDGREMPQEALRPRQKGVKTIVDELVEFAVSTANCFLVPEGIEPQVWDNLNGAERFYLKMLDLEAKGEKKLENYQNFAKAFKVTNWKPLMGAEKANSARLRSAVEFNSSEMSPGAELVNTVVRACLYGIMQLVKDKESDVVLEGLRGNLSDYYHSRERIIDIADYLSRKLESIRPEESRNAAILRDLVRNERS
jgi:putative DNA methylase